MDKKGKDTGKGKFEVDASKAFDRMDILKKAASLLSPQNGEPNPPKK